MISHHMVQSNQTSAHVQSFIEVDVTTFGIGEISIKMLLKNVKVKNLRLHQSLWKPWRKPLKISQSSISL